MFFLHFFLNNVVLMIKDVDRHLDLGQHFTREKGKWDCRSRKEGSGKRKMN
jgi:hypothetical protein